MASIALAQMQPTAASTPATDKTAARTAAPPPAPPAPAPPPPPPASAPGFKPSVPPSKKSNKLPEIHEVSICLFKIFLDFFSICLLSLQNIYKTSKYLIIQLISYCC